MAGIPTEVSNRLVSLPYLQSPTVHLGNPFFSNPTRRNFEPRVGFTWDPFGKGTTAVRASFGIYDLLPLLYLFNLQQGLSAPFALIGTLSSTAPGSFPNQTYSTLIADPSKIALRMSYTDPNPPRSYSMQWNFNIQHSITPSLIGTLGYTGSRGVHLPFDNDNANYVVPTQTPAGYLYPTPGTGTVVNPRYGTIRMLLFNDNSSYHGLTAKLQKRLAKGFQMQGAFTWSKSLDNGSAEIASDLYLNSLPALFWFDTRLNRGVSDYNIPRNLVVSGLWEVPKPRFQNSLAQGVLGGWQLTGIFQASDGLPFSPVMSGDAMGQGNGGGWEPPQEVSCAQKTNPGNPNRYINTGCYSFPSPPNLLGNNYARRNSLTGPGLLNVDGSVVKNTRIPRISEGFNLQLRAEFFNLLNRANFGLPGNSLFTAGGARLATAGVITATATTSREIQLGLKLLW